MRSITSYTLERPTTVLEREVKEVEFVPAAKVPGERRQTNFQRDSNDHWLDESFEIKLRNHKEEVVQVRVVEHMYRWIQWEVTASSAEPVKTDARTIEFRPTIPAGGEVTITYKVHYSW